MDVKCSQAPLNLYSRSHEGELRGIQPWLSWAGLCSSLSFGKAKREKSAAEVKANQVREGVDGVRCVIMGGGIGRIIERLLTGKYKLMGLWKHMLTLDILS